MCETDFSLENTAYELTGGENNIYETKGKNKPFNYFGIKYSCSGYMKGTFTATLTNKSNNTIEITDGAFSCPGK